MMRRIALVGVLAMGVAIGSAVFAAAPDWPQFHGPNRDAKSTETGLLQAFPAGGPPLVWQIKGLGKGYAGVAITGGRIFTMGDRGKEGFVIAYDLATHDQLWATKVGASHDDGGQRCTPTVGGDLVYALGPHGDLVCVEAATGKEVWRKNFERDFGGRMMSGWKYSESPLIDGDNLICTPGGKEASLVALNRKTGEVVWKAAVPNGGGGAGYSSPVVAEVGGIRIYVTLMGKGLVGVAAKDGKFLWQYPRVANGTANITTPIVRGEYVFGSSAYDTGSALLKLTAAGDGGVKAEEVYFLDSKTFMNHHGGVVLVGDYLYGGHGQNAGLPVCIEFKTGKIMWRAPKQPGGGSAAVIYADGNLIFRYDNGTDVLIAADPQKYEERGSFKEPPAEGPAWPHAAILNGNLYLRHGGLLLCYDIKKK